MDRDKGKVVLQIPRYLQSTVLRLKQVTTTKSLGVIIDDKLDWSSHTENLIKALPLVLVP